ncbi:uncharacterized protein BT62DRAFT_932233 [Guyanagaster necrorhizus]|uniref:Uncharacterized protein n=1 Tax=Guyanagaster necrorhizus TaxID=856835 RepID=A0A9P7VR35_9AGAR|nr:uncharacterized protein BT62DRAFT_932233 [Guyanagaster necrorhizus MCA 3950]KAG7445888.1 hypothetical protein BT62DRAFT_932233 [Guyanagaster necrorhizus MCA 3950]
MSEYPERLESQRRIRPLDPAAVRRRSHVSQSWHDYGDGSVSASTRSWVQSNQRDPPPPPEQLPLPSPALGLRAVNPDENEPEELSEYMTIRQEDFNGLPDYPSWPTPGGDHQLHVVNVQPLKTKKRFVGGFVTGLKRIPKAMFGASGSKVKEVKRQRQRSTETGTHLTENTLPQYRTNPPTPVALQVPRTHASLAEGSIPPALASGELQRRMNNPTFRLEVPIEVFEPSAASPTEVPIDQTRDSIHPESRRTSLHLTMPEPSIALPPSHPPSRRQSHVSPRPPQREPSTLPPPSIPAHPAPSEDYRRMSKADSQGHGPTSATSSSVGAEPSFSSDLNPVLRFITGLYEMPWVSPERITVDYRPGIDRGAWVWKWTHAKNGSGSGRGRKVMVLKPIPKVTASWYTVRDGTEKKIPVKERARSPNNAAVDLLSSGASGTRSSMATSGATSRRGRRRVPIRSSVFLPDPSTLPRSVRRSKPPSRPGTSSHSGRYRDPDRRRRRPTSPLFPHGYAPPTTPPPVPPFVFMPPPPAAAPSPEGSHAQPAASMPLFGPVYMQMLPPTSMTSVNTSPGMAGRGAGLQPAYGYGYSPMVVPATPPHV